MTLGWIVGLYMFLVAVDMFVPEPLQVYAVPGGLFIILFGFWVQEIIILKTIGEYTHLLMVVRGVHGNSKVHLFVSEYRYEWLGGDLYRTELFCKPVKIKGYGSVEKIYLYHRKMLEERLLLTSGYALYGVWVKHPKSDIVVVWEMAEPVIEYGRVIPQFWLVEAGADRSRYMAQYMPARELYEGEEPLLTGVVKAGEGGEAGEGGAV